MGSLKGHKELSIEGKIIHAYLNQIRMEQTELNFLKKIIHLFKMTKEEARLLIFHIQKNIA